MKNVVIKVSSNLINPDNQIDIVDKIAYHTHHLQESGFNVIIVTSGAVMYGMKKLNLNLRPDSLPLLQSCAAIGQISLMQRFRSIFEKYQLIPAQILVSADDFNVRKRYLNMRNTIGSLISQGAIPVFNENDTINTDELKLGDNDHLSMLITIMMDFEMLVILTDVDGVYNSDPRENPNAELLTHIDHLDESIRQLASEYSSSEYSIGGMKKKLESTTKAVKAGIDVFIGNGYKVDVLNILKGTERGTYIKGLETQHNARKKWLAFAPSKNARIVVDQGAKEALAKKKSSLLPSGIIAVDGNFEQGSLIGIYYKDHKIAQGLTNYSSSDISLIKGKKTPDIKRFFHGDFYTEVIHKDNLYLIN
ncbi:MAG: glutamate 5-kinase [Spirochaetes bacterium]|nr:glutamate 5-kinase [Spirochaetota bacterium]